MALLKRQGWTDVSAIDDLIVRASFGGPVCMDVQEGGGGCVRAHREKDSSLTFLLVSDNHIAGTAFGASKPGTKTVSVMLTRDQTLAVVRALIETLRETDDGPV